MKVQNITFTFLTGKLSATLIIPIEIARKHGLTNSSNVIVEETKNGILIKSNKVSHDINAKSNSNSFNRLRIE